MPTCKDSCPKLKHKSGSRSGPDLQSHIENSEDLDDGSRSTGQGVLSSQQSPSQRPKTVQIVGVALVEAAPETSRSQIGTEVTNRESPQRFERSINTRSSEMPERSGNSSTRRENVDWDTTGHNPCVSNCPMANARERALRKAELRQERVDNYLLTKGFSYFDDICTCSFDCLTQQLRRDKFVTDILKSVCLFVIGIKLCEELDAWNIFG